MNSRFVITWCTHEQSGLSNQFVCVCVSVSHLHFGQLQCFRHLGTDAVTMIYCSFTTYLAETACSKQVWKNPIPVLCSVEDITVG